MSAADGAATLTLTQARELFASFAQEDCIVIAVSGGPDSTALLWLAAQWRRSLKSGPDILAVTIDHGLRKEAAREAAAVKKLARSLSIDHETMRWTGRKPATGIQEAARNARYRLLAKAAVKSGARYVLTAHTLDDQAETVLFRLLRGSGPAGLQAMQILSPYPGKPRLKLARPLLDIPKTRLIATLEMAGVPFADDPSNRDPRHTRPRLRALMPQLAAEGLTADRLKTLARRLQRADAALRRAVTKAADEVSQGPWSEGTRIVFDYARFAALPEEIALRLLGQAVAHVGDEGPVELGKLESLFDALMRPASTVFRRTLAGALVTKAPVALIVERAPARRSRAEKTSRGRISALTKRETGPSAGSRNR